MNTFLIIYSLPICLSIVYSNATGHEFLNLMCIMFMTTIISVIINHKINREKMNINPNYSNNISKMSEEFEIYFKRDDENVKIPIKGSEFSAGFDLHANQDATIEPNNQAMISTGIHCTLSSSDYYLRVAPRSGLAAKHGINVLAGVVDYDYTGEIKVILINHGSETFTVNKFDRVAQLIPTKIIYPKIKVVDELPETKRGSDGFGSTGK